MSDDPIEPSGSDGGVDERDHDDAHDHGVLSVHFGRSANCSSIGSYIDFLFISGVVGSALLAAVAASLREGASEDEREPERAGSTDRDAPR